MTEPNRNHLIDAAIRVLRALNDGHEPYAASVSPMSRALEPEIERARAEGVASASSLEPGSVAAVMEAHRLLTGTLPRQYEWPAGWDLDDSRDGDATIRVLTKSGISLDHIYEWLDGRTPRREAGHG